MSKNKKLLVRILSAAGLYAVALVLHFLTESSVITLPLWAQIVMFAFVYLVVGYDVLVTAAKNIVHGNLFDENFLMTIATIGAFAIGEYPDAAAVMLLYQIGELFQHYAVGKSRKNIAALMDICPVTAVVLRDGVETEVDPLEIVVGDTVVVKAGDRIPIDGVVAQGKAQIDTSAITGESVPRSANVGDKVVSGCINLDGVLYVTAESIYEDSTVSKILNLVENVSAVKSPAENFITKFSKYYTPIVFGLAIAIGVVPPLILGVGQATVWTTWLRRAMMFLFVSCPCALVISVPLSFFGGIAAASKKGILVKGSVYLESLSKVDIVAFDKTGTLTKGNFVVDKVYPEDKRQTVLETAAIAEQYSNHPIALSICSQTTAPSTAQTQEIAGHGIVATTQDGRQIVCGNAKLMHKYGIEHTTCDSGTVVYVAQDGNFVGYIVIADQVKEDAENAIRSLRKQGVKTVMLTGDNQRTADEVANKLGIDQHYSQLLPQDKVDTLAKLSKDHCVAFVGDGINDAPVLAAADVGISMGAMGSDAAIESADIVLMNDNPSAVATAQQISKKTMRIVKQNIVVSLAIKFAVLVLSAIGVLDQVSFGLIIAILADVGVCFIAILNAMRAMIVKK